MFGDNVGSIEYDARINTSKLRGDAAKTDAIVAGTGDKVERTGERSFGAFGTWAKVGLLAAATATVALGATAFKTGVEYNTLQQTSRAALKTILGSTKAANDQMNKLNEFVRTSPFSKDIFIKAQQTLLGFGVAAEKVVPTLSAIQDSVAAIGGSSEDIGAITQILAKIKSEGRLGGEALLQLGGYGIDAATIIGSQMGKSGQEIRDMASQPGGIPADQVFDPLVNGLTAKFGGAAANVKNTWAGTADRIGAAFRDLGSKLAAPFINPEGGGAAIAWGNKFADFLRALPGIVNPAIETIKGFLTDIITFMKPVTDFIANNRQAWEVLKTALLAIAITIGLIIVAVGIGLVGAFALLMGAINVAVWVVEQFIQWIKFMGDSIAGLVYWFMQADTNIRATMASIVSAIGAGVMGAINWFRNLVSAVIIMIGSFVLTIGSGVARAVSFLASLPGRAGGAIAGLLGVMVSGASRAMVGFGSAINSGIGSAMGFIASIPGKIQGFFSGAGGWLVNSGKAIIEGLISGIQSMVGAAGDAAKGVVDSIKSFMPGSPAERGPFSGRGWTPYRGKALVEGFAKGITSAGGLASSAMSGVMGNLDTNLAMNPSMNSLNSLDSSGISHGGIVNNINSIVISSEVDADRVIRRLTNDQEVISKGLTPRTAYS